MSGVAFVNLLLFCLFAYAAATAAYKEEDEISEDDVYSSISSAS